MASEPMSRNELCLLVLILTYNAELHLNVNLDSPSLPGSRRRIWRPRHTEKHPMETPSRSRTAVVCIHSSDIGF